jgi:hypothetical protein
MSTDPSPSAESPLPALDEGTVVLELSDLLPDSGGEIVLRMTGVETLAVTTEQAVAATGLADAHVTAAGENVAGLRYYQLDGGVTLYCSSETNLLFGAEPV